MAKPPLVIDWDDTLVRGAWPSHGDWNEGAVEALHALTKVAKVIVFTSRIAPVQPDGKTKRDPARIQAEINHIRGKLDDEGLYTVEIHQDPWKPGAVAYVDDKAVRYPGRPGSWRAITPKLIAMCAGYEEAIAAVDNFEEVHG